jgi:hypothetical protein
MRVTFYISVLLFSLLSCGNGHPTIKERVYQARAGQSFEDSSTIFFVNYPNPFYDRQFILFYNGTGQDVEMRITDSRDSLVHTYSVIGKQVGQYSLAFIGRDRMGNVVNTTIGSGTASIWVANRKKCSIGSAIWSPGQYELSVLPIPTDD